MNFRGSGSQGDVFDKEFKSDMSCLLCILLRICATSVSPQKKKKSSEMSLLLSCVLLLSKQATSKSCKLHDSSYNILRILM